MKIVHILIALLLLCALVIAQEAEEVPNTLEQPASPDVLPPSVSSEASTVDSQSPEKPSSSENPSSGSDTMMCATFVIPCPNGTYSTMTERCEIVCGSLPVGGLSWAKTQDVMIQLEEYFSAKIISAYVTTLAGKNVVIQSPPESPSDYCIQATLTEGDYVPMYPTIFQGVRVIYTVGEAPDCSPVVCPDGTLVGCNEVCQEPDSSFLFTPMTILLVVVILSACCCCIRRRRCRARCNMNNQTACCRTQPAAQQPVVLNESFYPAESYQLLREESEPSVGVNVSMDYPMYPPMPVVPPHMMMPNGAYPVMVQGPNGAWYPMMAQGAPQPQQPTAGDV